jgi:hypothetical protein
LHFFFFLLRLSILQTRLLAFALDVSVDSQNYSVARVEAGGEKVEWGKFCILQ